MYLNEAECNFYAEKYEGKVHCVTSSNFEDISNNDDVFVENLFNDDVVSTHGKITAYLIMIEKKVKIDECLLPIKYFIYTYQRLQNLLTYRQIINNGLTCYGS